ncbi:MAG TPA: PIN domain-containing protein [Bryobacteraceae bacterium]
MSDLVLDAWAIIAWLKDEQPAEKVESLLKSAERRERKLLMNIVNIGEVFYASVKTRDRAYGERVLHDLRSRIATVSADDDLAMRAARLKAQYAISYADAFAAATAIAHALPLVTGDPELRKMAAKEKTLKLEWIGE